MNHRSKDTHDRWFIAERVIRSLCRQIQEKRREEKRIRVWGWRDGNLGPGNLCGDQYRAGDDFFDTVLDISESTWECGSVFHSPDASGSAEGGEAEGAILHPHAAAISRMGDSRLESLRG